MQPSSKPTNQPQQQSTSPNNYKWSEGDSAPRPASSTNILFVNGVGVQEHVQQMLNNNEELMVPSHSSKAC